MGGTAGDDYQIELRVPNPMVGLVIGKGGESIQRMQSQTGVNIQIAKEQEMRPGDSYRCTTSSTHQLTSVYRHYLSEVSTPADRSNRSIRSVGAHQFEQEKVHYAITLRHSTQ